MPRGYPTTPGMFWAQVDRSSACWDWTGRVDADGYGRIGWAGRSEKSHRAAWLLTNGPIPTGLLVCHRCDRRICCNPSHLYLGTVADNARDRSEAGSQTGSRNGFALLTEPHVIEIKGWLVLGAKPDHIASRFGVSPATIYAIRNGTNWSQVRAA